MHQFLGRQDIKARTKQEHQASTPAQKSHQQICAVWGGSRGCRHEPSWLSKLCPAWSCPCWGWQGGWATKPGRVHSHHSPGPWNTHHFHTSLPHIPPCWLCCWRSASALSCYLLSLREFSSVWVLGWAAGLLCSDGNGLTLHSIYYWTPCWCLKRCWLCTFT